MIVARYDGSNLIIKGNLYTLWKAFEENDTIDETRELDDTFQLDDTAGSEVILEYLFGITTQEITPNKCFIDIHGELVIPVLNQNAGGNLKINANKEITLPGTLTEGGL